MTGTANGQGSDFDALIVGAGFAGMYMLHRFRGMGLKARVIEAADGVGGTWYWNRYPGARCDVESMQYSYQFSEELQQEWEWSERYATQPEILKYANHVADRFDLRGDIQFNTKVERAIFDEARDLWSVSTSDGKTVTSRFCIMATGCLSTTNSPDFPGLKDFKGEVYHTGQWPHEGVDFSGKRVGVIGTGSSAIQSIPEIAKQAEQLTIFQRTAHFTVPAHNAPLNRDLGDVKIGERDIYGYDPAITVQEIKATYKDFRARAAASPNAVNMEFSTQSALDVDPEERRRIFDERWARGGVVFMAAFDDLLVDADANKTAADFVCDKIHEIVEDQAVADLLSPKYIIGCKRLVVDTDYFATYNRANVSLVDISQEPIECLTEAGVRAKGEEFPFDALVFATGFDAMTGTLKRIDIQGLGGVKLRDHWDGGPRNYLGIAVHDFPNMFTVSGPGSPSVLTNMIPSIEQHVDWISNCIGYMTEQGLSRINPELDAENEWVDHVNQVADASLRSTCASWYVGANVPGKPRVFMPYIGGFAAYAAKCEEVAAKGYEGFSLR
jgi:cation diffusion facilitator CzcD-associated flavoprotein CzcO